MKKILLFAMVLIVYGCGKDYVIQPFELPVAHLSQHYEQIIEISGGRVAGLEITNSFPDDMGVIIQPVNPEEAGAYNRLKVVGIPKYKGEYIISVSTGFYGGGSAELNKTYNFIVKD